MTPKDLTAFQRLRVGPDGQRLTPDGVLGPKTRWALALDAMPLWRSTVVLNALAWVGHTETTPNSSVEIDSWLQACGAAPGNPWCAAFASAMLRGAGIHAAEASVRRLVAAMSPTTDPLPGDLSFQVHADGTGHVGIVTGVGYDTISTCEGNSGNAVRAGLRRKGEWLYACPHPDQIGIPGIVASLPMLGSSTR